MPSYVYLIILAAATVLLVTVFYPMYEAHKLRKKIAARFGRPPAKRQGLATAEDFYKSLAKHNPAPTAVDGITWNDLDMDTVYGQINQCESACGDVRLYTALRRLPLGATPPAEEITQRENLINTLKNNPKMRLELQYQLARLGRYGGSGLDIPIWHTGLMALPNRWLFRILAFLPLAAVFLFFLHPGAAVIGVMGALGLNAMLSSITKEKQNSGFLSVRFLATALRCARTLAALLQAAQPQTAAALRSAAGGVKGLGGSILMLSIDDVLTKAIGFNVLMFFNLPMLSYGKLAAGLKNRGPQVQALYAALGEADLAAGILGWRTALGEENEDWCIPGFTTSPMVDAEDLYHPLVNGAERPSQALRSKTGEPTPGEAPLGAEPQEGEARGVGKAVPNTARFEDDVLLTGSNASGKSTFIKSLALGCITAQALNTVCARRFVLCPGQVCTSMAVADSVVDGDSYFVAEIKSMRRLVQVSENSEGLFAWLFIDEILKGTNTTERVAASTAVLEALSKGHCLCFAATHDIELTTLLAGKYKNYHFRETVDDTGVWFDYKLHEGPSTTRNAILLLEKMDFPKEVTQRARELV